MVYETERYLCVDYFFIHIIKVLDKNKKISLVSEDV